MKHRFQKCGSILAIGIAAFLLPGIQTNASGESNALEDAYRQPALSGSIETWVYQGETFDFENSKNRIFADDLEDGDLTAEMTRGTVNTAQPGEYTVSYQVTDSDRNSTSLETKVKVLERTAAKEEKTIQRILYTLPAAPHLTNIGFNRGYYHDRQNLGIWLPQESELKVRLANAGEFQKSLDLQLKNNDDRKEMAVVITENEGEQEESQPKKSVEIPADGSWITVKNKNEAGESADSVPFITTPKDTTVQPVIEVEWNDDFEEIPYYRYQDHESTFFQKWEETEAPYAIIEGSAATFLVPAADKDNIIDKQDESYPFHTIDEMLEWYAAFVEQYDRYAGLDFYAREFCNQNVREKFFIKANAHGVGAAYYTQDHSANNGEQLGGYLARNWVCLHEFGHGYEGSLAWQENPFVETTNNIMGYYFESTYRTQDDHGWMLYNFSGSKTERYAALGALAKERRSRASSFDEIIRRKEEPEEDKYYNVTLFMFTNALDKLGPEKTVKAMHTQYRKHCYENGHPMPSSDVINESFSKAGGYNMIPYFEGWYIRPSQKVKEEIYDMDLPMLYYLKDLVTDQEKVNSPDKAVRDAAEADAAREAETIRERMGLDGIYSLVSTDELADTGYTSQVNLQLSIDDILQIQGKEIQIKNGTEIVKRVPVTGKNISIELPVGIYEVELPMPRASVYRYEDTYLIASRGRAAKEFQYVKVSGNPLIDDIGIELLGVGDQKIADISISTMDQTLTWNVEEAEPHYYFDDYAGIRVFDASGTEIFSQTLKGNETAEKLTKTLDFPVGSKIEIYHEESGGRLKFVSDYSNEKLSAYQLPNGQKRVTYVMTELGLMQSEWMTDKEKQKNVYLELLKAYSESVMSGMTQEDFVHPKQRYMEKMTAAWAYEFLDEAAKDEYSMSYGALIGRSVDSYQGYIRIDNSKLRGSADSESDRENEGAEAALDGNEDTFWHSYYGTGNRPKPNLETGTNSSYTILLEENTDLGRLEYLPREGGGNGTILTYELSYSETASGDNFRKIKIKNNTWEDNGNKKSVDFYAPNAKRIKITALSTGGSDRNHHVSAAEFYLYERYETTVKDTYLSDLYPDSFDLIEKDRNGNGDLLSLFVNDRIRTFEKGIGLVADTIAAWNLSGRECDILTGYLGIDAGLKEGLQAVVEIYGDGELLHRTDPLLSGRSAEFIYLNIEGVDRLEIKALSSGGEILVSFGDGKLKKKEDAARITLKKGESASVSANASFMPEDFGKVTWESEDEDVAAVGKDGVITAVGEGTTTVKAYYQTKTISCIVKVENNEADEVKQQLRNLLKNARTDYLAREKDYTKETWQTFLNAYEAVKKSGGVTDILELQRLAEELDEAMKNLVKADTIITEDIKIEENKIYESNGCLYRIISIPKKTAALAGVKDTGIKQIKIEKTAVMGGETWQVVSVDANAFLQNKTITKITIAAEIESIDTKAFFQCTKLKTVIISSKKLKTIGNKAFFGCKKLKTITLKTKKLSKIGKQAFGKIHKKAAVKVPKNKYNAYRKKFKKVKFKK